MAASRHASITAVEIPWPVITKKPVSSQAVRIAEDWEFSELPVRFWKLILGMEQFEFIMGHSMGPGSSGQNRRQNCTKFKVFFGRALGYGKE